MKASEFYNDRSLIETFGRSKVFETCRRLREVLTDFPQYEKPVNEFHAAWIIYLMAKTGKSTQRPVVYNAVLSGKTLHCGKDNFIIWLGNLLANPQEIKKIRSIWVYEDANCVQVNMGNKLLLFQGDEKVKEVARLTQLSGEFLYELALKLNITDESQSLMENELCDDEMN